jgi:hypothetical protein
MLSTMCDVDTGRESNIVQPIYVSGHWKKNGRRVGGQRIIPTNVILSDKMFDGVTDSPLYVL